jgi:NAD(P)-dependent dehydrogenase (short-subunit alcohol dehydrogenase family)
MNLQETRIIMKQVILITGASSGFGKLAAMPLANAGHTVFASLREVTGRNVPVVKEYEQFAKDNKVDVRALELDVSSENLAKVAVAELLRQAGRLDGVIHNGAGNDGRMINIMPADMTAVTG